MINQVRQWGLEAIAFTSDSWYASKDNLNLLKNVQMGFVVGVAKNRQVRVRNGTYQRVDQLNIPELGLKVHLKAVGMVKVFCQQFKNESRRYYVMYQPEAQKLKNQLERIWNSYTQFIGEQKATIEQANNYVGYKDLEYV